MPTLPASPQSTATPTAGGNLRLAFILVTSLFFLWGFSYGLLDVLNKHFQEALHVTRARSGFLQMAYFGAYFLMALPAAWLMQRRSYKFGILFGLGLFAAGALLFIPATARLDFNFFLFALFVIACGAAFLETAANPYVTVLGDAGSGARRLNFAQSFNGLASFLGPLVGGALFFKGSGADAAHAGFSGVQGTYVAIAIVVACLALLILRTPMPDIREQDSGHAGDTGPSLFSQPHFVGAVIAQFFYVAAQVGVNAYFINYVTEQVGITSKAGAYLLAAPMLCFVVGRFFGTAIMGRIRPVQLLTWYAIANVALTLLVVAGLGWISVVALVAISFFMSIMFPTIFALGVEGLGAKTKRGASFIVMAIVGGALVPPFMGWVADHHGTHIAYLVATVCFAIVAVYGMYARRGLPA